MHKKPNAAVIISHGQPSAPGPAEADLASTAAAVAAHLPGWEVRSATLAAPGRLETTMEDGAVVYPFFMSQGYFTSNVLPGRLQGFSYRLAQPFGLDEHLPDLAAEAVRQAAATNRQPLQETHLLLAAHGSARGPRAAEATETFAASLIQRLPGCRVSLGYVEQAPRIAASAAALPARSLCLPFFAQAGDHVKQDLPEALEAADFVGTILPVTGALPGIPALIANAIRSTAADSNNAA
ncbi:cobalamin biosynthesis protein CbiX [Rhodobacteraceae bacterium (ex Bugula neritina AB1)]|nr:cobalamin biosynthesis protein CbiX [Rhodobacteraceae bacterium (ex Bugula neritina AB1)]